MITLGKIETTILVLILALVSSCRTTQIAIVNENIPQYVVLKLDDLNPSQGEVHVGWVKAFEYLNKQEVFATIGLIGKSLEDPNQTT